jgi:hypothetical protein
MSKLFSRIASGFAAVFMLAASTICFAGQISFVVEGTVNFIDPALSSVFTVGDTYRLEYTFESTTPDSNPANPNRGFYDHAISSLTVTVGSYTASPTFTFSRITADNNLSGADSYRIDLTGVSGPGAAGLVLGNQTALMQMRDPTALALSSDSLPIAPLDPLDFVSGGTFLALQFDDPISRSNSLVGATIDSFNFGDSDDDGVNDDDDFCPDTNLTESVPTRLLGVNRFALADGDNTFDTTSPRGEGPGRSYTTTDTAGCSCTQIIEAQSLGEGHAKFGCSISAMDDWIEFVTP